MKVHPSARRHGVADADSTHAAENPLYVAPLDDENDPHRELRLGFDTAGRLLEVVVLRFDSGNELLIHAMKARSHYRELLQASGTLPG